MVKAIQVGRVVEYIPKEDRNLPSQEQTVFLVTFLTASEIAQLRDSMYEVVGLGKKRKELLKVGSIELDVLKKCLKGWKNFKDEDGKEVEFDASRIMDMIDRIPPAVRTEIADFVRGESELSELE